MTEQNPDLESDAEGAADATEKSGGLGEDGTIPADGVGVGHTGEASTFETEEDEGAGA